MKRTPRSGLNTPRSPVWRGRGFCLFTLCAALGGCAGSTLRLSNEERLAITRAYEGEVMRLSLSLAIHDFFGAPARLLASPWPRDSVDLLRDESGHPILPAQTHGILPLGTPVRVEAIHFPSPLRARQTPEGAPTDAVFRQAVQIEFTCLEDRCHALALGRRLTAVIAADELTRASLTLQLERLFSTGDPQTALSRFDERERAAIIDKRLVQGMSPDAAALAWGWPEFIEVEWRDGVRVETWRWPLSHRRAVFHGPRGLVEATPE